MAMIRDVKPVMPTEEEQLRAFRSCKPLSEERAAELCPGLAYAARLVADTLSVCWEWGLFAILTLASSLIPADRFEPAPSISLQSSMWVVLLQPGSTNSSSVTRVVTQAAEAMFARLHALERQEAEARAAARGPAEGNDGDV
eukprot:3944801-Lingulodinium_polyedra.AAC.1